MEPLYQPAASATGQHTIHFTRDYFSSALHEIAHWTIAGSERRQMLDYGYWYSPDGRTATQQRSFEQVEIKPQAIEWIFSLACKQRFHISADNLDAELGPSERFKHAVWQQARNYLENDSLPVRAKLFLCALMEHFGSQSLVTSNNLQPERL